MTKSVIKLPNGTTIEVSPDLSPQQITAMITALTASSGVDTPSSEVDESGEVIIQSRNIQEIWDSSKKERVALFVRAYMSETLWFSSKDIMDQQLAISGSIVLGETSALGTYLARLFDSGYLDKKKSPNGRSVHYRITEKLIDDYPAIPTPEMKDLLLNTH